MATYLVILCVFGALAVLLLYLYKRECAKEKAFVVPPEYLASLQEFKSEIDSINESVRLLENFAGDYFMTLNESGFRELCDISESLSSVHALCNHLLEKENLQDAQEILTYISLNKGLGVAPAAMEKYLPKSAKSLVGWRERIRNLIEVIDLKLSEASDEFVKIGRVRKGTRNPTSTILGEVRKVVFGETAESTVSEDE